MTTSILEPQPLTIFTDQWNVLWNSITA